MTGRRELTPNERGVLVWVLDHGDFQGIDELKTQVNSVVVPGSRLPCDLDLEVTAGTPRSPCRDGLIPIDVITVDSGDDPVGFIQVWAKGGYLHAMEYGWVTDEMPVEYPDPSRLRPWTH